MYKYINEIKKHLQMDIRNICNCHSHNTYTIGQSYWAMISLSDPLIRFAKYLIFLWLTWIDDNQRQVWNHLWHPYTLRTSFWRCIKAMFGNKNYFWFGAVDRSTVTWLQSLAFDPGCRWFHLDNKISLYLQSWWFPKWCLRYSCWIAITRFSKSPWRSHLDCRPCPDKHVKVPCSTSIAVTLAEKR